MAERIDIDGVRFRVGADLKDLEAGFKKGEQLGAEAGKKTGSKFSQAFGAVVSAVAGAQIVGAMKTAFDAANRLEKTMLGLQATAKLTGQSFAVLSKSVNDLAKDGVMNIDQAAQSMKVLAAQGVNAQKSFEFLEAAKKVSAFNNIVGDAGQGVQDFVKFLQTGSAELAENMDASIVAVVKRLGGYAAVTADATKKQQLMNAVIEKGGKLTGDYDKFLKSGGQSQVAFAGAATTLAQTFGQKLQPAMAAAYNMGAKILTWVSDMIAGLDGTTVAITAFSAVLFAGISSLAKGAALLPGIFGSIGAAVTASLGPIGLLIAAVAALTIAYQKAKPKISETQQALNETLALKEQIKELEKSKVATKELAEAKQRLSEMTAKLNAQYKDSIEILRAENAELETKARLISMTESAESRYGGRSGLEAMTDADLKKAIAEAESRRGGGLGTGGQFGGPTIETAARMEVGGLTVAPDLAGAFGQQEGTTTTTANRSATFDIVALRAEALRRSRMKPSGGGAGGKRGPEARFIEARDQLKKLKDEYTAYLRIERDGAKREEASTKYFSARRAIEADLRGAIAEYNEETVTAQQEAAKREYEDQVKRIYELANVDEKAKERVAEDLQKAQESYARQNAQIYAESFARTMQGANAIASGFAGALRAQNIGQALGGFGGIAQGIGGLSERFESFGVVGQGIAAAGGIISTLTDLFGKSDAERAREAEEQKRRDEEAKALLELQANYQKSMLALQEAAAKLPFENLTRNLRLVDIQAQQATLAGGDRNAIESQRLAQRQALMQGVLTEQAGTISGGQLFGGVGSSPTELIGFLSERAAQSLAVAQFLQIVEAFNGDVTFGMMAELARQGMSYKGKIPDELFNAALPLFSGIQSLMAAGLPGDWRRASLEASFLGMKRTDRSDYEGQIARAAAGFVGGIGGTVSISQLLGSEITRDTGTAENLLSVIEQQLQTQQEIQKNTKVTADRLSETPGRNSSIIDISRGFSRSLGAIVNPQLTNTGLPQSIAAAVLATDIQKSIQERTVKGIEDLVTIQRDSRELLSIIGKTLAGTNTANSALLVQLEDLYRRSMAA